MQSLPFKHYHFDQIPNYTLYQALKLRSDIFVVEQACVYPDLDDKDTLSQAVHVLLELGDEQPSVVAYARCLPPGVSYPQASIGRVAICESMRGKGVANELMKCAISLCQQHWPDKGIQIGAQVYLQPFYTQLGFAACSKPYDEDGIMHIDMLMP